MSRGGTQGVAADSRCRVAARGAGIGDAMRHRSSVFAERAGVQHERFNLPAFPTTTIGSFPQTARSGTPRRTCQGRPDDAATSCFCKTDARAVRWQENIGLDVPCMASSSATTWCSISGEQTRGLRFHGSWLVQSYGSRYVRPPVCSATCRGRSR